MKLTGSGATAVSAITNAANRRAAGLISEKGMQGVLNLYGRTAFEAVQAAMAPTIRKIMIESSIKIMGWTAISIGTSLGLSYL